MITRPNAIYKLLLTATGVAALTLAAWSLDPSRCAAQAKPAPTPAPLTGTWTIDPVHTSTTFSIRHLGLSEVHGRFDDVAGTIVADAKHPESSSVSVTIQTASVNTDNTYRDTDLKSANYFDAVKYPTITFQSTHVAKNGKGDYVATGSLTIHGVTKSVVLPFHVSGPIVDPFGASRIGLVTQTKIERLDYGVGSPQTLLSGDFAIGNDVSIEISVEATPAAKTAAR